MEFNNAGVTASTNLNMKEINGVNHEPVILLYPVPAKDVLYMQGLSATTKTITVIDLKGKILQQVVTAGKSYSINTTALTSGVYFIRINELNKTQVLKFIRE